MLPELMAKKLTSVQFYLTINTGQKEMLPDPMVW